MHIDIFLGWSCLRVFLCCNYSQEILSNALSDYTKCQMGSKRCFRRIDTLHASGIPVVWNIFFCLVDFVMKEILCTDKGNESKLLALLEPVLLEWQYDGWSCAWRVLVLPTKSFVNEWRLNWCQLWSVCLYVSCLLLFFFLGFGEGTLRGTVWIETPLSGMLFFCCFSF